MIFVHGHVNGNILNGFDFDVAQDFFIDDVFDVLQLFVGHAGEVREIKAQMPGINQRTGLLYVLAQDLAQPGMKQMRGCVVAHCGLADVGVDSYSDAIMRDDSALCHYSMGAYTLHGLVAPMHFGKNKIFILAQELSHVPDLPAGICIEWSTIENDLPFLSREQLWDLAAILDNCQDKAAVHFKLLITQELSWLEFSIDR